MFVEVNPTSWLGVVTVDKVINPFSRDFFNNPCIPFRSMHCKGQAATPGVIKGVWLKFMMADLTVWAILISTEIIEWGLPLQP